MVITATILLLERDTWEHDQIAVSLRFLECSSLYRISIMGVLYHYYHLFSQNFTGQCDSDVWVLTDYYFFCYGNSGFSRVTHERPGIAWLPLELWNKRNQSWFLFYAIISWSRHWLNLSSILLRSNSSQSLFLSQTVTDYWLGLSFCYLWNFLVTHSDTIL